MILPNTGVSLNQIDVALVTTDEILDEFGGTATVITDEIIRDFTEHMWENWAQPTSKKPQYLLLIGDHEDTSYEAEPWFLPTHEYYWDGLSPSDSVDMVGNDEWYVYFNDDRDIDNDMPDMMVGRLSVKNGVGADTLSVLIENLIDLEDPVGTPPTPNYRRRVLRLTGTGSDPQHTGFQAPQDWDPARVWTSDFTDWMDYDYSTYYCGDGRDFIDKDGSILSSHEFRDACLTEFSRGAGVAFYSNHGDFHMLSAGLEWLPQFIRHDPYTKGARDSTFNNYQIEENLAAVESHSPPFVLLLACGSGTFNHTSYLHENREQYIRLCHFDGATTPAVVSAYDFGTDCLGEKFLKHTDVPVAGIFCGSLSSLISSYECYGKGILEAIYMRGHGRLGDAIASARIEYEDYFMDGTGGYKRELGQFNLLGDPALDISDRVRYPNHCDLIISENDITVSEYPRDTATGTDLPITFTVRNAGAQQSDAFDARITLSSGGSHSNITVACDELDAGAEAEYSATWDCDSWFIPPMEVEVSVEADYLEECDDSWLGNNTGTTTVQLNDTYPMEDDWPIPVEGFVSTTPLLVNLDTSSDLEIVAFTGTVLTAFEPDGTVLWKLGGEEFTPGTHPMAADLNQDGNIELIIECDTGLKVISKDGTVLYSLSCTLDQFVVGNMHQRPGLELCTADNDVLSLYLWNPTLRRFVFITSKDLNYSQSVYGKSLACSDITGDSYDDVVYVNSGIDVAGESEPPLTLVVYDWRSATIPYTEAWSPDIMQETYAPVGELGGAGMIGFSLGSYDQSSEYPAMLIEPDGTTQEYDCEKGTVSADHLRYGVFADWDPLVSGADAFVLPSEVECLAWNYLGQMLADWPTDVYLGPEYMSAISPTALGDLDSLDDADVLFSTELSSLNSLLAYDSEGDELDNLGFPIALPDGVSASGGFSIADIDSDGKVEIVFGTSDGYLHCWEFGSCATNYAPWVQFQHDAGRTGVFE